MHFYYTNNIPIKSIKICFEEMHMDTAHLTTEFISNCRETEIFAKEIKHLFLGVQ